MFNRIYQIFFFFFSTTRFFSKILGPPSTEGGLRQLPNSPKGRAGPVGVLQSKIIFSCNFFCMKVSCFDFLCFI